MQKVIVEHLKKGRPEQWVAATAYHGLMAGIIDPLVDIILVGDSLDMVLNQQKNTLSVDLETMAYHGLSVANACSHALVVIDMPFGSYQKNPETAFENAAYLLAKTGADALKLEVDQAMIPTVEFLVNRGIPIMGHIGLLPQYVKRLGRFLSVGGNSELAKSMVDCAQALSNAGVFALVAECVKPDVAKNIVSSVNIPLIGIGSGNHCDGQIVVTEDLLGLTQNRPSFAPFYADLKADIRAALSKYSAHVKDKTLY